MPMHKLIEYSANYWKTSGSVWQYYRDKSFLDANGINANFSDANNDINSSISKQKITSKTVSGGLKDVEIILT